MLLSGYCNFDLAIEVYQGAIRSEHVFQNKFSLLTYRGFLSWLVKTGYINFYVIKITIPFPAQ